MIVERKFCKGLKPLIGFLTTIFKHVQTQLLVPQKKNVGPPTVQVLKRKPKLNTIAYRLASNSNVPLHSRHSRTAWIHDDAILKCKWNKSCYYISVQKSQYFYWFYDFNRIAHHNRFSLLGSCIRVDII